MTTPTMIAAYVALFVAGGAGFLFFNLFVGRFLRPRSPNRDKLEIYECGEPTIGSSFVQFDLRFYVVALLFVIFDVEVALLFPWAVVYGKAAHLMDPRLAVVQTADAGGAASRGAGAVARPTGLSADQQAVFAELGVPRPGTQALVAGEGSPDRAASLAALDLGRTIAWLALVEVAVFFAVLLVGFAYVWRRGDLDWVRATTSERPSAIDPRLLAEEPALTA